MSVPAEWSFSCLFSEETNQSNFVVAAQICSLMWVCLFAATNVGVPAIEVSGYHSGFLALLGGDFVRKIFEYQFTLRRMCCTSRNMCIEIEDRFANVSKESCMWITFGP